MSSQHPSKISEGLFELTYNYNSKTFWLGSGRYQPVKAILIGDNVSTIMSVFRKNKNFENIIGKNYMVYSIAKEFILNDDTSEDIIMDGIDDCYDNEFWSICDEIEKEDIVLEQALYKRTCFATLIALNRDAKLTPEIRETATNYYKKVLKHLKLILFMSQCYEDDNFQDISDDKLRFIINTELKSERLDIEKIEYYM